MLLHILLMVSGTMSIGYLVHRWFYWRIMGASVPLLNEICSGEHMVLAMASAGFVMSWFNWNGINILAHILMMMIVTVGAGYLVHVLLYRLEMRQWVDPTDDACSAVDLLIALGTAGLVTSFL